MNDSSGDMSCGSRMTPVMTHFAGRCPEADWRRHSLRRIRSRGSRRAWALSLIHILEKLLTHKRHVHLLWIVSSICLFITVVLKYKGITTYVHDLSPIFTVFTMGMYTMFLTIGTWDFPNWVKTVVRFLDVYKRQTQISLFIRISAPWPGWI